MVIRKANENQTCGLPFCLGCFPVVPGRLLPLIGICAVEGNVEKNNSTL